MRLLHNVRLMVLAAAWVLSTLATPSALGLVLDWDSVAWANGSQNNSYDLNGNGTNDITVSMTAQNSNIWTNDPATGTLTPAVNQSLDGGVAGQNSLMIAANLKTNSNLTVQISFFGSYPGANNVSFTIFDIDVTTNSDIIDSIYGLAPDGSHIAPTITNIGSTVDLTGSGLTQTLSGNAAAANNTSNGNATISFGSTIITSVFFTFSNTAGAPRYQDIALGDISFSPVPEMNPAMAAGVSCIAAFALTIFLRRRAGATAKPLPARVSTGRE